jgi:hypothetical protein
MAPTAGHPGDVTCFPMDGPVLPGHDTNIVIQFASSRRQPEEGLLIRFALIRGRFATALFAFAFFGSGLL